MTAYVYDANEVNTNIDGKIVTGYSEGTMVSCSKDEEKFSTKVSAKGDVSVATKNNPLGTITLTLSMGSPFVPYLNKLANTAQTFPIWVTGGQEKIGGTEAMVKKPADAEFSDEIGDREFEIQVFDYTVLEQ
ncbi:phage structural protein [Bacillus licheniformis]|uniref:phage structural protein n=1 Tax=Bacillus licheniformis TaxID=1402 RepID=UPI0040465C60